MKRRIAFFLLTLVITSLLVASAGAYLKYDFLKELGVETDESIIALPFVLFTDRQLRYNVNRRMEEAKMPTEETEPAENEPVPDQTEALETEPTMGPEETVTEETLPPETEPAVTEPVYVAVDESWFDDVLFIGESRTLGLKGMGRLGDAVYFCKGGLSVFGVMSTTASDWYTYEQTLEHLLTNRKFGKIYIHLGINELGGDMDDIISQYQKLIDMIHEKQPDAYIILQAIMSVSREYAKDPRYSLENIKELNARIATLAVDERFRFIDVNEWVSDEEGYLREEMTHDGCHLQGVGYQEWSQWLLENAGWLGIP